MPNCFQLTKKNKTEPEPFSFVNREICEHFKVSEDGLYYHNWYDYLGLRMAFGWDYNRIKSDLTEICLQTKDKEDDFLFWKRMDEIFEFIASNYSWNAWYETKK